MATRWGCAGAARISSDFFTAIKDNLAADEHQFVSVAARDKSRAEVFARNLGFQKAYGSYQDLANDSDVEVVYIGTVTSTHVELTEMMLTAGKHVVCEKPMSLNLKQASRIHRLAKEKNLFYLEAVWSRFLPSYGKIREELSAGTLGDIRFVQAEFCVFITNGERIEMKDLGGVDLIDIGIYPIQLACMVFDEMPEKVTVEDCVTETGVDESSCILLKYKDGSLANLIYHTESDVGRNIATIQGENGRIEIDSPLHATTRIRTPAGQFDFPLKDGNYNFINSAALQYEANEVRQCLLKGLLESQLYSHRQSEMVMRIMDEVRRQLGFLFPVDSE